MDLRAFSNALENADFSAFNRKPAFCAKIGLQTHFYAKSKPKKRPKINKSCIPKIQTLNEQKIVGLRKLRVSSKTVLG